MIDIQYMYVLYCNYIQTLQRQASEELEVFLFFVKKKV